MLPFSFGRPGDIYTNIVIGNFSPVYCAIIITILPFTYSTSGYPQLTYFLRQGPCLASAPPQPTLRSPSISKAFCPFGVWTVPT